METPTTNTTLTYDSMENTQLPHSTETDKDYRGMFSDKMHERGLKLQQKTLENIKKQREQEKKIEESSPADELAKEWFSQDKLTVGTRAYLLDSIMPSVVHGVEAMLQEVDKKKVLEEDSVKFDPVNYLGEYLMRHNPGFFPGSEKSAYVRGLEQVVADLKNNVFDLEFNRLGQLKEELKENQENRGQVESIHSQVMQKRKEALSLQFQEWTLDVTGRIPLALVQSALKSFFELVSENTPGPKPGIKELETVDTLEQKLSEEEFKEYVYPFISHINTDFFQEFLHHMAQCADMFRETIRHDIWRQRFSELFLACDAGKVGFLDRQRVLALLEIFYDVISTEGEEWQPRNPRQWPVIEIGEMDQTDFWVDFKEGVNPTEEKGEVQTTATSIITTEPVPAVEDLKKSVNGKGEGTADTTENGQAPQAEDNGSRDSHFIEGKPWSGTADTTENGQASQVEDNGSRDSHFIEGKPWSGDLLTSDLAIQYSSYGDRSQDECHDTVSKFTDLYNIISDINTRGPSRIPSAFNGKALNLPQFVQLMETFVGDAPLAAVEKVTSFIQKEYVETEEERIALLAKVHQDALLARQKLVLQALFEKWDNDGSGFLELEEVDGVLIKYKEGMELEAMAKGRENLTSSKSQRGSSKLSASEFFRYILGVIHELPGPEEEAFENVIEFLTSSVERTQADKLRGASRRKWLQHIQTIAETSGGRLDSVYKAVSQALCKDAEAHGNNKKISANIGLLEQSSPGERWNEVLRYVACTSEDALYVLNKTLNRDMKGVSFAAVDSGIPQHVPRVQYHGNIQFWNKDRPEEERKGSLIVLPLIDTQQRVFGTLSIDTLREPRDRNIFLTHEISFYQGVTNAFSSAYHHIQRKRDILQLVSSAFAWIYSRAPNIRVIDTYLMEPCTDKEQGYAFRNMMHTDNNTGISETFSSPATLRRRDNLFRDYLFKCADSSEVITTDAYGERHIAVPIRDHTGRALGVLDLNTGGCKELPPHEYQDLQKMLQMLQEACNELLDDQQFKDTAKKAVLEAEQVSGQRKVGVLFHRFMLQDLRQCVSKLDYQSFAELKSYKEPPVMVHNILKAVLLLFFPEWDESEEIHSWNQCKLKVNSDLIRKILSFDPTAQYVRSNPEILTKYIKGIPRGAVWKQGSIPAEHLFNWAFTCLSLMELSQKMQNAQAPSQVFLRMPN
ncbi:EF-hand calcium-binding domain-containing protein 5 isoform X1 [Rana temporaria]|uniref:EF-hand calcium-binding domain-containing protein 5 isoform X1 n=1 Tax=Rana temporaria TaxID=8407 RepID=UPI001AAD79DC|nr:EF-hand calcium-binding domain-containing protein 5 isoform X1 [Rana temporaria]